MSYHINVKNNKPITYKQLLESKYLSKDVLITFEKNIDLTIEGYSRFYINGKSTRGVAITVNDNEYALELNIGSSKHDYILATNISVAFAEFNNSLIIPEFSYEYSIEEFRMKYDENWANIVKTLGVDTIETLVKQNGTMKLPCCVRPYYFGPYMVDNLHINASSEQTFASNFIESIRHLQFIENDILDLEIPAIMEGDFPEGVKTITVVLPEFKLLLQKCDYIILRIDNQISRIEFNRFIEFTSQKLERIDEEQYILNPISKDDYIELITQITIPKQVITNSTIKEEDTKSNWWKFWKK